MIPLIMKLEICNKKSLSNVKFNSNTNFLFLHDQKYFGSSISGTNTTSVATSVTDDSLEINSLIVS